NVFVSHGLRAPSRPWHGISRGVPHSTPLEGQFMRIRDPYWKCFRLLVLFVVALAVKKAWASEPEVPIVHILATDPCASETGQDTATFTVFRTGPTNAPLTVHYRVDGTAINGVDYAPLSGSVTIPACASSAPITVTPVDDMLVEGGETVAIL